MNGNEAVNRSLEMSGGGRSFLQNTESFDYGPKR